MFIAAEILIFSARAQSYMWVSVKPSIPLIVSVIGGCFIFCIIAGQSSQFADLPASDILLIWVFDLVSLIGIDIAKVQMLRYFKESHDVLPDLIETDGKEEKSHLKDIESGGTDLPSTQVIVTVDKDGNLVQTPLNEVTVLQLNDL
jgi:hypothetical protein